MVGQEPIERTLKNALLQDKVSHAYLFTGPRGTGKTTTARLLAKALLCENGPTPEPDGTCEDCQLIADGVHPDVYELDAASRTGVDNVREEIITRTQFAPTRGRYKVYIIDEVHMLSTAAFNALLKTLEEPPAHVVFILCTTDPQKVPETIHSRCQRFDFRRIAPESIVSRLGAVCMAEGVEFEGDALDLIAHRADGGLRNALTSLEQIIAFENGTVTLEGAERLLGAIDSSDMAEIMAYVGMRDVANCFKWTAEYVETGADLAQFVRDMAEHVRNLYLMSMVGDDVAIDVSEAMRRELASELQWFGPDRLCRAMGVLGDLMSELKTSTNPRLSFEIAMTRLVRPDSDLTLESLSERIEALESGYSAVSHVIAAVPVDRASVQVDAPASVTAQAQPSGVAASRAGSLEQGVPTAASGEVRTGTDSRSSVAPSQVRVAEDASTLGAGFAKALDDRGASQTQTASAAVQPQTNAAPAASEKQPGSAQTQSQAAVAPRTSSSAASGVAQTLQNPAALQRIWQSVLSTVKKQKAAYGVLFMNTKVTYDVGADQVRIEFPAENEFAFKAVQKDDVYELVSDSFARAAGGPVSFMYARGGDAAAAARGGAQAGVQQDTRENAARTGTQQAEPVVRAAAGTAPAVRMANAGNEAVSVQPQQTTATAEHIDAVGDADRASSDSQGRNTRSSEIGSDAHAQASGQRASAGSFEDDPYDYAPYDDVPYDYVPFDADDGYGSEAVASKPVDTASGPTPYTAAERVEQAAAQATSADRAEQPVAQEAAGSDVASGEESPADIEAMLQASFGGGVLFREVSE